MEGNRKMGLGGKGIERRKRGNLWQYRILTVLLMCILLTACAGKEEPGGETSQKDGTLVTSEKWKNGFKDSGQDPVRDGNTAKALYHSIGISKMVPDGPDFNVSYQRVTYDINDESVFYIKSYRTEDGWKYDLQQYDIQTGELYDDIEVFQEENLQGYFDKLCLLADEELAAIFVAQDMEGVSQELRLFTFGRSGEKIGDVQLDYAYRQPPTFGGPMMGIQSFLYDGNYFYLINYLESGLLVFDREGKTVRQDMPDASGAIYYTTACSAPDGGVIASKANLENGKTDLFYLQGEKEKHLGEIPGTSHRRFAMGGDGCFYYFENDSWMIRWDTSTGEKTVLLDGAMEGIETLWLPAITFSAGGRVLLHRASKSEAGGLEIRTYSEEEVETEGRQITFAVVEEFMDLFYRTLPPKYNDEHPLNQVELQTHDGEFESYRTRVMADILNGGGPDVLLLRTEDIRNLYENDALLDLTEYIDPELKESIFPNALARGVIDGKLVGVNPMMQGSVMLISNAVWEGDSWTIEDIVRLADERKPQYLYAAPESNNSPGILLFYFFTIYPEKSPFLDLEAGICDFENETFIHFLEICKEYGERPTPEEDEIYKMLETGECLCTRVTVMNMSWFSREMKPLEKICHFVGFPGQEGFGTMGSYEMLAVNANSENKEAALEFLRDLLSLKIQQSVSASSIREDVVRASVKEKGSNVHTLSAPGYDLGDGSFLLLEKKEDGSSFLEEYVTALKGLELQDSRSNAVMDIVESEADLYFEGVRTAEQTAAIIQNRVQLYLNENR